jgi:sugar lactone lactonase YvrE
MRRFLTLVCLLCLAVPAGISISGCTRNPDANYCNGQGYGLKITDIAVITLQPKTFGISLAYGQTQQVASPQAFTCQGDSTTASTYAWGTTNNQLVDISPTGNMCAGTWNRNTGGGIANYTICSFPDPRPSTGGLPYGIEYITASANSVTSNPVTVYVHPQVTSVSLVTEPATGTAQQCFSQNTVATLDAQACYVGSNNKQYLLCAPSSVTSTSNPGYACPLPAGVTSVPDCSAAIGNLNYSIGTLSVASLNTESTVITAELPGTTAITASVAGGSSSAGYFSTCPPQSISVTLANGETKGTITQGVTQNLTTTILDTNGHTITGLALDYQSTDPIDISTANGGAVTTSFPGVASVYAICQPAICNPVPINLFGLYGTGLSISSNPVNITVPGTASDYLWFSSPGQSQYVIPVELLSGSVGSTVRLPYVPNSVQMDRLGNNLYFGSSHELMIYNTSSNSVTKQDTSAPGVVLAVAPNNTQLLINDQLRQVFYLYSPNGGIAAAFGGLGNAASWTPDAKTLYVTDSAALNNTPENIAAGITNHSDTLYVYNVDTGWSSYSLSGGASTGGSLSLAVTIPGVGAYLSGSAGYNTVAHTWCPTGTVVFPASGNPISNITAFYPQSDSLAVQTDVLAATTDGQHILGAAVTGSGVTFSDIGVAIPTVLTDGINTPISCPSTTSGTTQTLKALSTNPTLNVTLPVTVNSALNETTINQVVTAPQSNLAFLTYTNSGITTDNQVPYYKQGTGVGYVTLGGSSASAITAPIAGAFSPDSSYFFVSTSGDNMIHYISVPTLTDTQQISPNLPACTPVIDFGCTYSGSGTIVPATAIGVKPRPTT